MGEHATHAMHGNSLAAYDLGQCSERELLVLEVLTEARAPLTDRQIAQRLHEQHGLPPDLNTARPRVTALVKERRILVEVGKVKDPHTGKSVRITWFRSRLDEVLEHLQTTIEGLQA